MQKSFHLAVDAMGGDVGVDVTVPAVCAAIESRPDLSVSLYGDAALIAEQLGGFASSRLQVEHCAAVINMDDRVSAVLRSKLDSSLARAIEAVSTGRAQAVVSAGNTAALVILGLQMLGTLPGITRPALCCALPNRTGRTWMLDMGATLEPDVEQLVQFARMGACQAQLIDRLERPRVGLLNVGAELCKGTSTIREVASRLEADEDIHYCGFAEGVDICSGRFDVIVCDGFAGNVALKTAEGVSSYIGDLIGDFSRANWLNRLALGLLKSRLRARFDPAEFNGATLLGLGGLVIKSRGGAKVHGFARAIELATALGQSNLQESLRYRLGNESYRAGAH